MAMERVLPKSVPSSHHSIPQNQMQQLKVSAKNVEEVCGAASMSGVEEMDGMHPSVAQLGQASSTPPMPVLPTWVTQQSLKFLEHGGDDSSLAEDAAHNSVAVVVPEHQLYADMLHVDVPVCPNENHYSREASSDSPEGFVDIHGGYSPSAPADLHGQLRHQLEYYFSRENLMGDTYLRSQMDNDQYVPIKVIANFPKVKRLTDKLDLIVRILRESPYVQVDEHGEKVRPAIKRSTLILRDIADSTHREEVLKLFDSSDCPKLVSVDYASNNSWYVNFDSDSDAQKAFCFLRMERKTFNGKPILARIKTGPVPRGGAGTPSPQGGGIPPSVYMNGYRPAPPNTLPGLLAPASPSPQMTPNGCTPPPSRETGNSPPQDPIVFTTAAPSPHDPPTYYYCSQNAQTQYSSHFDLGQILNMHGYELHATYKPPIIAVPPSTMQQIAASHQPHNNRQMLRQESTGLTVPESLQLPSDRSSNSSHESNRNQSRMSDGYGGGAGYSGGGGYHQQRPPFSMRGGAGRGNRGYRNGGGGYQTPHYDPPPVRPSMYNAYGNYNGRPDAHNRTNNYDRPQTRFNRHDTSRDYERVSRRPGPGPSRSEGVAASRGAKRGYNTGATRGGGGPAPSTSNTGPPRRPTPNPPPLDDQKEHDFNLQPASFPPLPTSQQTSPTCDAVSKKVSNGEPPRTTVVDPPQSTNENEDHKKETKQNQTNVWTEKGDKRCTASFSSVAAGSVSVKAAAPAVKEEKEKEKEKVEKPAPTKCEAVTSPADSTKRMSYAQTVQKPKLSAPTSVASSNGEEKCKTSGGCTDHSTD